MSANIAENHCRAFEALTGGGAGNLRPFARYVDLERRIGNTLSPSRVVRRMGSVPIGAVMH